MRRFLFHDDTDQFHAILLGAGDKRLSCHVRVTGLASHQIFVSVRLAGKELILGMQIQIIIRLGGGLGNIVFISGRHLTQQFVVKKLSRDQCQIVGRGIMIVVMETVCGHKMGIFTAKLFSAPVHQLRKCFHAAADMLTESICRLVGAADKDSVHALLHSDLLPLIKPRIGTVSGDAEHSIAGHRYHLIHLTLFGTDQAGEDLGGAGGVELLVDIFLIKDSAGVRFHKDCALRSDSRAVRPVFIAVGCNGKGFPGLLLRGIICYCLYSKTGLQKCIGKKKSAHDKADKTLFGT